MRRHLKLNVIGRPNHVRPWSRLGSIPLYFAIVMILTLNVAKIAEVPYERAIRESAPFFASHLVVIVLVSLLPAVAL